MPRTIIKHPKDNLRCSLGRLAYWWMKTFVVYGPGAVRGQPLNFGPERLSDLYHMYALDPDTGGRLHSSAFLSKCKGADKSGMAGYLVCFEAVGPCRFDGWAQGGETYTFLGHTYVYRAGEPMGRSVLEPVIRCMATEENQTSNVYEVALFNFQEGPLAALDVAAFDGYIETPGNGKIYPSTSGASSKDGGRETFVVFDETHLWNIPRLRRAYSTVKRNLTKRPLEEPWYLETTTMYAPGEESVAEKTYELALKIQEGKTRSTRLLFIHQYGMIKKDDIADEVKLRAALDEAAGEAAAWLDANATIHDHFYDPREDLRDSIRYYLNALEGAAASWIEYAVIEELTVDEVFEPGDEIALGFDGSLTGDSTALVGVRLRDNLVQVLHLQEAPLDPKEAKLWSVDKGAVNKAVHSARETYTVKAFFGDPPFYQDEMADWQKLFGDEIAPYTPGNSIMWWTSRKPQTAKAVERTTTLFKTRGIKLSRNPALIRHIQNTRVWPRPEGDLIGKELKNSPKKMDISMAMVLGVEAAAHARTYVPKEKKEKDVNHGLIAKVPLEMLVPGKGRASGRRRVGR